MCDEVRAMAEESREHPEKESGAAESQRQAAQIRKAKRKWRFAAVLTIVSILVLLFAGKEVYIKTAHVLSPLKCWQCRDALQTVADYAVQMSSKPLTGPYEEERFEIHYGNENIWHCNDITEITIPDEIESAVVQLNFALRYPLRDITVSRDCVVLTYGVFDENWFCGYVRNELYYSRTGKRPVASESESMLPLGGGWYNMVQL